MKKDFPVRPGPKMATRLHWVVTISRGSLCRRSVASCWVSMLGVPLGVQAVFLGVEVVVDMMKSLLVNHMNFAGESGSKLFLTK